ncbi:peptidase S41 [Chryseobacterium chendengshani]|uniref:S41 family peptidase n=1 Tax=Chryseobacterium sp. LJ668 TaxID=2864040 RepID=UPI001C6906CC|nr:S41 family peptidase [Chryseobacterium sp. LJ668]MBW8524818.1 peptidase S41 [Chryseobacterium sp. LJ668]QYK15163.1 peptidase S41 [Chryseobacterium sp. LJ668]
MKKHCIILILLLIFTNFQAQKKIENLNFEIIENNFPKNWNIFGDGNAKISVDATEKQQGKYSATIESTEEKGFKALAFTLPENYAGKKIKLSGYLKTENVSNGFAGLWMRIDPQIAFDNMKKIGLKGTNPWKKYEVTLEMSPENTKQIVLGALLAGKGKIWIDELKVSIDGRDISKAKVFEKIPAKVELDKEFDDGSKLSNINLDAKNTENLKNLGLIWGYLKYYHPNIAKGNYNWDYELFRLLPKLKGNSITENDKIYISWIKNLGEFETTKIVSDDKNIKIKADLDWITSSGFSQELTELLLNLKYAKRSKINYYVDFFDQVNNPDFKNENPYKKMSFPDEGFRLLSLYRYWNIIQYYFPYKNLIEEDWKKVLPEFIPKFLNAKNQSEYTLAALEIIARIHDTHANIWGNNKAVNQYFGERYSSVKVSFVENKAIVTDFYKKELGKETRLQKGDIIVEVNGENIDSIIQKQLKYTAASNYPTQLREIARNLLCSNSETIHIKFLRDGIENSALIKTYTYAEIANDEQKEFFEMFNNDVAYLYMGSADSEKLPEIFEKIKNTKGLVIDFRSYPSDFVVFKLGKLLKPNSTEFVKFSNTNNIQPGVFTFTPSLKIPGTGNNYYKGKIAILINETTQSSAEYHTMGLRTAPNAKVFGSTTSGADGNVSKIMLPGNISTMISGIGIYYPDGKETQRVGIIPDIVVKPTIEGIKTDQDEVLEKAVNWITN